MNVNCGSLTELRDPKHKKHARVALRAHIDIAYSLCYSYTWYLRTILYHYQLILNHTHHVDVAVCVMC